jgi:DNA mismatch endonuclease (patch repair protein)
VQTIRRKADIAFTAVRIAVFIDGCFWHGCPLHYVPAKSNEAYWLPKIEANRARDVDTNRLLREQGWIVLRYWAHENPEVIMRSIIEAVQAARSAGR